MTDVLEVQLTVDEIRQQQSQLATRIGLSVPEAYAAIDRGEYAGTILQSELNMLRFLLGEDE